MLSKLNWCSLEIRRKQSDLLLLFKLLSNLADIPDNLLPVYSPGGINRTQLLNTIYQTICKNKCLPNYKLLLPQTISHWSNLQLHVTNLSIIHMYVTR